MTATEPPRLPPPPKEATPPRVQKKNSSPVAVILLYLVVVFFGAALIAPRLYQSAQFLVGISYRFSFIADPPFHRFVSRCLILLAILGLPSLFRELGFKSAGILRGAFKARHWAESIQGFCWGFVALALLAVLLVGFEARELDLSREPARWMQLLKSAAISAVIVGVLEEILFRGALFGTLRARHTFLRAALYSSVVYALLHFLERPEHAGRVQWNSGFVVLAQMLSGFTDFSSMIPAFINLAIVGFLLALVFERTGSILFSIGMHAGFVFWLKTLNIVTNPAKDASRWFWGSEKVVDGWATCGVLIIVFLLLERTLPPRLKTEPT